MASLCTLKQGWKYLRRAPPCLVFHVKDTLKWDARENSAADFAKECEKATAVMPSATSKKNLALSTICMQDATSHGINLHDVWLGLPVSPDVISITACCNEMLWILDVMPAGNLWSLLWDVNGTFISSGRPKNEVQVLLSQADYASKLLVSTQFFVCGSQRLDYTTIHFRMVIIELFSM